MHYKTNRQNHDFQIAYFIAGACHTPDAAYAILHDLKEDRSNALKMFKAAKLREQAKTIRAQSLVDNSTDTPSQLEAMADLAEIEAMAETTAANYEAALAELEFIEKCIEKVQPLRKFAHLPNAQAFEAAQQEEWKLTLIHQAENSLLTTGTIPTDHFATMRMHPEFESAILPSINHVKMLMANPDKEKDLITRLATKSFDLPKLLGNS
jgi:hypothetical protein